jgi:hypothetical protein
MTYELFINAFLLFTIELYALKSILPLYLSMLKSSSNILSGITNISSSGSVQPSSFTSGISLSRSIKFKA